MALEEAQRCLQCKHAPCMTGCPVQVQIPNFIKCIIDGDMELAYDTIRQTSSLPAVCGRVCPQERQCEKVCEMCIRDRKNPLFHSVQLTIEMDKDWKPIKITMNEN